MATENTAAASPVNVCAGTRGPLSPILLTGRYLQFVQSLTNCANKVTGVASVRDAFNVTFGRCIKKEHFFDFEVAS